MKKKQIGLMILSAALLLSACGTSAKPAGTDTGKTEVPGTEKESEAQGNDRKQDNAGSLAEKGSTVSKTSGGVHIRVDYSNYKKQEQLTNLYTRLSEEWIPDLTASDSYGKIYPFRGAGNLLGFVDESGRIVADPTYVSIENPQYTDESGELHYQPFWIMARTEANSEQLVDDYWIDGTITYAVATLDGSFVTECKYGAAYAVEEGIKIADAWDAENYTIIDAQGKEVKPEEADGGALYTRWEEEDCYFVDSTGKKVLGPYSDVNDFRNGRAVVRKGDWAGLIDKKGNYIIDPKKEQYTYISAPRCTNWYEAGVWDTGYQAILDENCRLIAESYSEELSVSEYGYYSRPSNAWEQSGKYDLTYYDKSGKKAASYKIDNDDLYDKNYVGIIDRANDCIMVENPYTGAKVTVKGADTTLYYIMISDTDFEMDQRVIYTHRYDEATETSSVTIYDSQTLKPILENLDHACVVMDAFTDQRYLLAEFHDGSIRYMSMDDYSTVVEAECGKTLYGSQLLTTKDKASSYENMDGKIWFRYLRSDWED